MKSVSGIEGVYCPLFMSGVFTVIITIKNVSVNKMALKLFVA